MASGKKCQSPRRQRRFRERIREEIPTLWEWQTLGFLSDELIN